MIRTSTIETILGHRSVRGFVREPLPEGAEATLREAMRRGPSSSALQTYTVVFVHDADVRARLRPHAGGQAFLEDCALFVVACADLRRVEQATTVRGYPYRAPDLRLLISSVEDLTIATHNASLAAQSMGLGTVMIGGVLNGMREIHDVLGLPPRVAPVLGLCVGTPAPEFRDLPARPRLPETVVFHRDRFELDAEHEADELAAHDREVMARGYYDGRRIAWSEITEAGDPRQDPIADDAYGWTEHVARKQSRTWWLRAGPKLARDLAALGFHVDAAPAPDPVERNEP